MARNSKGSLSKGLGFILIVLLIIGLGKITLSKMVSVISPLASKEDLMKSNIQEVPDSSSINAVNLRQPASIGSIKTQIDPQEESTSPESNGIHQKVLSEGSFSIPWLKQLALNGDFESRIAIRELSRFNSPVVAQFLGSLLSHENSSVAYAAVEAVIKMRGEAAAPELLLAFQNLHEGRESYENEVGTLLVQALGDFQTQGDSEALANEVQIFKTKPFDPVYSRALIEALSKKNDSVAQHAIENLASYLENSVLVMIPKTEVYYYQLILHQIQDARGVTPEPPIEND